MSTVVSDSLITNQYNLHKGYTYCCCVGLHDIVWDVIWLWPISFKIGFFSVSEWCQDRGSEYTTGCHAALLCNLASSASPPHGAPIRSSPRRWNDSSNSTTLQAGLQGRRGSGGGGNYGPPSLPPSLLPSNTHTHALTKLPESLNKNCAIQTSSISQSHLALTSSSGLSYKPLWCETGVIQA